MNTLVTNKPTSQVANAQPSQDNPFSRAVADNSAVNVGSVSIEVERAIAEAQGQMVLAKRFPRNLIAAHAELMQACKSLAFSQVAFYSKPQGGSMITGPSIRMAEQLAQVVGNFQYGHRELSRSNGKSEVEVFAWDMEKNNYNKRQKTVLHVRDTRDGAKPLRDQTDVDQKINNVASKEMRGLIIAMMPKWLVEDAIAECRKTLAGTNDEPISARIRRMLQAFMKFGVTQERLEKYLGHPLDSTSLDELADMTGMHNLLREGTPIDEVFLPEDDTKKTEEKSNATVAAITNAAKATPVVKKVVEPVKKEAKEQEPEPENEATKSTEEVKAKVVKKVVTPAAEPEPEPEPEVAAGETGEDEIF